MACPVCAIEPRKHSFTFIGVNRAGIRVFYTNPAHTIDLENPERLSTFIRHVRLYVGKTPWVWVFDCGDMEVRHYPAISFLVGLGQMLEEHYDAALLHVYNIRPTTMGRCILNTLQALLSNRLIHKVVPVVDEGLYLSAALKVDHGFTSENIAAIEAFMQRGVSEE